MAVVSFCIQCILTSDGKLFFHINSYPPVGAIVSALNLLHSYRAAFVFLLDGFSCTSTWPFRSKFPEKQVASSNFGHALKYVLNLQSIP